LPCLPFFPKFVSFQFSLGPDYAILNKISMTALSSGITLIIFVYLLVRSADLLVSTVSKLARLFHISEFLIGVIFLGLATSTPELFVGLISTFQNTPQLSLGNLIGASIILFSLLAGLAAIFSNTISTSPKLGLRQLLFIDLIIILPVVFLLDKSLSRFESALLIAVYILRTVWQLLRQNSPAQPAESPPPGKIISLVIYLIISFAALSVSSTFVVKAAVSLATSTHTPLFVIGLLLLSLGTNLPEITLLLAALRKHHQQLVLGDILGSATANTLIIGLIGFISPFTISSRKEFLIGGIFLGFSALVFSIAAITKRHLTRKEGFVLVALYLAFLISEFAARKFLFSPSLF